MTEKVFLIISFQILISFVIILISVNKGLTDKPSKRKVHNKPVPYTGGLIISFTFLFIVFVTNQEESNLNLLLSYTILSASAGLIDDIYDVNPGIKIILQTLPILFLINQNLYLTDIGVYEYLGLLKLGSFDKIFTIFCCLFLINSCNYSDGIDGLLSIITISSLISFYLFLIIFNSISLNYLLFISLPFFIFIFFNFSNKKLKVFLGDSGSNLCGFLLSFVSIILYNNFGLHPSIIIWSLAYLVYEFLSVNLNRLVLLDKIFTPGKDHLHYELKKKFNLNNMQVVISILLIQLLFTSLGICINLTFNSFVSILLFIILFFVFFLLKRYVRE